MNKIKNIIKISLFLVLLVISTEVNATVYTNNATTIWTGTNIYNNVNLYSSSNNTIVFSTNYPVNGAAITNVDAQLFRGLNTNAFLFTNSAVNASTLQTLTTNAFAGTNELYVANANLIEMINVVSNSLGGYVSTNTTIIINDVTQQLSSNLVFSIAGGTNFSYEVITNPPWATTNYVMDAIAERAQILTYYVWGSSNGPIAGTKWATLATSALLPSYSNTASSVTNGQLIGAYSINHEELPTTLQVGIVKVHANLVRTGNNNVRTIRGIFKVMESNMVTLVTSFTNTLPAVAFPNTLQHVDMDIPISTAVQINDGSNRLVKAEFYALSGWTGSENIQSYSQDGYVTHFEFPANAAGIYALESDFNAFKAIAVTNNYNNNASFNSNLNVKGFFSATNMDSSHSVYRLLYGAGNTCTIVRAMGERMGIILTNNIVFNVDMTTFPTNEQAIFRTCINPAGYTVTFNGGMTNTYTSLTGSVWHSIIWDKPCYGTKFEGTGRLTK